MGNKSNIIKIARACRKTLEDGNAKLRLYAPHMNGACLTASVALFDELTAAGFKPILISSQTHMFVVCDGHMVDITATQFGHPCVIVQPYEKIKKLIKENIILAEWWDEMNSFGSVEEASLTNLRLEYARIKVAAKRAHT